VQPPILFPEVVKSELSLLIKELKLTKVEVQLHPFVAHYLKRGFNSEEKRWRRELGCRIRIQPVDELHFLEYRVFSEDGQELHLQRS
jgi:ribonuclease G